MQVSKMLFEYNRLGYYNAEPKLPGRDQELFRRLFNPINELIRDNEQGVWYDPSDFSTMFQDAAGTTPVTAVEQPVGLILDKSKGLVLGMQKWSDASTAFAGESSKMSPGVYRIYSSAGVFSDVHISGVLTAGKFYEITFTVDSVTTAGAGIIIEATNATAVTTAGAKRFVVLASSTAISIKRTSIACDIQISNISVRELPGNHAYQSTSASRPVLSARVNQYLNTATLATQNVTTLATTYTLRFEGTGSITLSGTATGTYTAGAHSVVCIAGTLTSTVTGTVTNADLRVANDGVGIPAYQRVNTATDYDTAGFKPYLLFDGVDDYLVTNSIDFTATDKMTVFAGVRKLSDALGLCLYELSAAIDTNAGTFDARVPAAGPQPNYLLRSKGTSASSATTPSSYAAPHTSVLTHVASIGDDINKVRVNGTQMASSTSDQGTGNYGNYPLYIGSRAGTVLRFNGQLYGLVIRGALSDANQIANAERFMNSKTGAY